MVVPAEGRVAGGNSALPSFALAGFWGCGSVSVLSVHWLVIDRNTGWHHRRKHWNNWSRFGYSVYSHLGGYDYIVKSSHAIHRRSFEQAVGGPSIPRMKVTLEYPEALRLQTINGLRHRGNMVFLGTIWVFVPFTFTNPATASEQRSAE